MNQPTLYDLFGTPFVWALWSDDGKHIVRTSLEWFDGAVKLYRLQDNPHPQPTPLPFGSAQ